MTIKVNGMTISVENTNSVNMDMDIEKEVESIESMSNNINKSIEALNIISNIKAVESFGYKSTEAVVKSINAANIKIVFGLINFLKKIITTITDFIRKKVIETKINLAEKKLKALKDKGVTEVVIYPEKWNAFITKRDKVKEALSNVGEKVYSQEYFDNELSGLKNIFKQLPIEKVAELFNRYYKNTKKDGKSVVSFELVDKSVKIVKDNLNNIQHSITDLKNASNNIYKFINDSAKYIVSGDDLSEDINTIKKLDFAVWSSFANICGKSTAMIMSFVSAVTSFSSADESPKHSQNNQQTNSNDQKLIA